MSEEKQVAVEAWVSKKIGNKSAPEENENMTLDVRTFVTEPAIITRGYGLTLNLGNYESARVDVGIRLPCYREEVEQADEFAREWCESRIRTEVDEVRGGGEKSV